MDIFRKSGVLKEPLQNSRFEDFPIKLIYCQPGFKAQYEGMPASDSTLSRTSAGIQSHSPVCHRDEAQRMEHPRKEAMISAVHRPFLI